MTGRNGDVCGTYIHGIFDRAAIATALVTALAENKGLSIESCIDYKDFKEKQYDKLADILSEYLNIMAGENYWMGFPHLYYPSNPEFARSFVEKALHYKSTMKTGYK